MACATSAGVCVRYIEGPRINLVTSGVIRAAVLTPAQARLHRTLRTCVCRRCARRKLPASSSSRHSQSLTQRQQRVSTGTGVRACGERGGAFSESQSVRLIRPCDFSDAVSLQLPNRAMHLEVSFYHTLPPQPYRTRLCEYTSVLLSLPDPAGRKKRRGGRRAIKEERQLLVSCSRSLSSRAGYDPPAGVQAQCSRTVREALEREEKEKGKRRKSKATVSAQ